MSNTWFQFQQFRIEQGNSAMKVCTDACLQGAWTARHLQKSKPERILDIGAGTGLLALMLAQETSAVIHAIELDSPSAKEAVVNFGSSPWSTRLWLIEGDVRTYNTDERYDFIISNPPFFKKSLRSPDARRTAAMHAATLSFTDLRDAIARLLKPGGQFSVMLPPAEFQEFRELALEKGYYVHTLLNIHRTASDYAFRAVGIFGEGEVEFETNVLTLQDADLDYTVGMAQLLGPYYLYL
ncbi:methyltransferase [Chitinophaga sp.]|uniref:tRNA1(Val) (adenine(37)-N6)-methyltransferase n=1 Tax=Chitinophaga sp. TaxID=1869181 RepID=UPI002633D49B|nr:methyltransferase [uncultured Chitinophaga sp.]